MTADDAACYEVTTMAHQGLRITTRVTPASRVLGNPTCLGRYIVLCRNPHEEPDRRQRGKRKQSKGLVSWIRPHHQCAT